MRSCGSSVSSAKARRIARKPTGAARSTPSVPRKSRSPSALTVPPFRRNSSAVATARSVTPAPPTSASNRISPHPWELRPLPCGGERKQLAEPVFLQAVVGREEQCQIAVAIRAEPVKRKPVGPGIAARIDWRGRGQADEAVALLIRETKTLG